ncbi:hypothetical protein E2C01_025625 [Portunus trituberculatus]|uniref:Uncharacterized protein n=1 Tax=Portunus trituberculatus TaxID=210409 RepID=A0A5B7EG00_PORTR|nr:hypothetical protein [Portunus trituberculatus]
MFCSSGTATTRICDKRLGVDFLTIVKDERRKQCVNLPGMRVMMAITVNICLANKTAILSLAALDLLHHFLFILLYGAIPRGTNTCCGTASLCSRLTTHICSPGTRGSQGYSMLITSLFTKLAH